MQTTEEARAWLHNARVLIEANNPIDVDALKIALHTMMTRNNILCRVKDGIKAVALGMNELRVGKLKS